MGQEQSLRTKKVPQNPPPRWQRPEPNPLFMPPHPHHSRTRPPSSREQPEIQDYSSPSIGPCPSLTPRGGPGTPPQSSSAPRQAASGNRGAQVGRELVLRTPVDPSSSPSPPPSSSSVASRASSSPVVSRNQLIPLNFSQLGLTGRRERCSPGREERERREPGTGEGEEGHAQLPGKCSSLEARPLPHPGSRGPE